MITRALRAIQLTGLYSQALIEWNTLPPASQTWDTLKAHFTMAYIIREQSGTGTTTSNGYHTAANIIETDNTLANIESTLNLELAALQQANNVQHQQTINSIADIHTTLAATQQQLALMASAAPAVPQPIPPMPHHTPNYNPHYGGHARNNYRGTRNRSEPYAHRPWPNQCTLCPSCQETHLPRQEFHLLQPYRWAFHLHLRWHP